MSQRIVVLPAILTIVSACAFAVDGVTLINQSTVMAAGGFPYQIIAPGSYQLSGNLAATAGKQAILIQASNVVLNLNGFNVSCEIESGNGNPWVPCVGDSGAVPSGLSDITVRNGTVTDTLPGNALIEGTPLGVGLLGTNNVIVEELHVETVNLATPGTKFLGPIGIGVNSILRHNIFSFSGSATGIIVTCPSILESNVNVSGGASFFSAAGAQPCVLANNVGISVIP